jgi:hypothetical protein
MEPEGRPLCSQEPVAFLYPQPDQSSPRLPIQIPQDLFSDHSLSTPTLTKWFLSLRFPHQNPVCTSPLTHTCHQVLFDLITRVISDEE